jgi:hypothetical protein
VDARVDLLIGDEEYYETTMDDGVAYFVLPGSAMGMEVSLRIRDDTIEPIDLDTTITSSGSLAQPVPTAESTVGHKDPGAADGGGFPAWLIGAIVAVLAVLILVFLVVTRRIGGKKRDSFEEIEPEGGAEDDTETVIVDDLEDLTPEVEDEADTDITVDDEEVHMVEPPADTGGEEDPGKSFKDLPRTSSRKQPEAKVERVADEKDLSSVDAEAEVETEGESEDTNI